MRLQVNSKPTIIVDTREQDSLEDLFSDAVIVRRGTLRTGDYTIEPPVVEPRPRKPRTFRGKRHPEDVAPAHTFTEITDDGEVRDAPHAGVVVDMRPPSGKIAIERKSLGDLVGCVVAARRKDEEHAPLDAVIARAEAEAVARGQKAKHGGRERFERELARLSTYEHKAIVVEASLDDVWLRNRIPVLEQRLKAEQPGSVKWREIMTEIERVKARTYRANVNPLSVMQSTRAWHIRYGVPTIWAGSRKAAAEWIEAFLVMTWEWRVRRERWSLAGAVKPHVGADGAAMPYGDGI